MKFSQLFPYLDATYYKNLGTIRGMYHDGISGLIVQITIYLLFQKGMEHHIWGNH